VTAVLDGGDFFHVKTPSRNSHRLVALTAKYHASYPCPVFSVPGNHDIAHNNLESVSGQPLGVLYETGVFKRLHDEVFEEGDLRVRVVGLPFSPTRTLEDVRRVLKQPGDSHLILVMHALAGRNPPDKLEDFFGEPVFRYEDLIFEGGPDIWCFGHWHKDQGLEEIAGRWFVNQGAVSRGALSKDNLDRIPKVALLRITRNSLSVVSIPLKVLPSAEVFDLARKEQQEAKSEAIDKFVSELYHSFVKDLVGGEGEDSSVEDMINQLDFAADVRALALSYLEKTTPK